VIFAGALLYERFAAAALREFLGNKKIFERGVVNIPILADATAGDPPVPTKAGDVVPRKVGGSRRVVRGNIAFTVEENFVTHGLFGRPIYLVFY